MAHYSSFRGGSNGLGINQKSDPLGSTMKFDPPQSKYGGMSGTSTSPLAFYTPGRVAPTNSLRGVSSGPGMTHTTGSGNTPNNGSIPAQNRYTGYSGSAFGTNANPGAYSPSSGGPVLGNRRLLDSNPSNLNTVATPAGVGIDYKSRFGKESHTLQSNYKPTTSYGSPSSMNTPAGANTASRPMTAGRLSEQSQPVSGLSNETYGQLGTNTGSRTSSAQPGTTGYTSGNRWANQNRYIANNYSNYSSVERRTSSGMLDGNRVSIGHHTSSKLEINSGFSLGKTQTPANIGLGMSTFNTASKANLPPEINTGGLNFDDNISTYSKGTSMTESANQANAAKYYGVFTRNQGMERASKTGGNWATKKEPSSVQPFEESYRQFTKRIEQIEHKLSNLEKKTAPSYKDDAQSQYQIGPGSGSSYKSYTQPLSKTQTFSKEQEKTAVTELQSGVSPIVAPSPAVSGGAGYGAVQKPEPQTPIANVAKENRDQFRAVREIKDVKESKDREGKDSKETKELKENREVERLILATGDSEVDAEADRERRERRERMERIERLIAREQAVSAGIGGAEKTDAPQPAQPTSNTGSAGLSASKDSEFMQALKEQYAIAKKIRESGFASIVEKKTTVRLKRDFKKLKTIILDLDETLIHSEDYVPGRSYDYIFVMDNLLYPHKKDEIGVYFRPYLMEFLERLSKKFELVIFTAGRQDYADHILDRLDPENKYFSHRLYRQHCDVVEGLSIGAKKDFHIKCLQLLSNRKKEDLLIGAKGTLSQ